MKFPQLGGAIITTGDSEYRMLLMSRAGCPAVKGFVSYKDHTHSHSSFQGVASIGHYQHHKAITYIIGTVQPYMNPTVAWH